MPKNELISKQFRADETFRDECYRCFRAASVCICDRVQPVENRTGVIVLQHHREVTHPIGTARIARLGLRQVEVRVAKRHNDLQVNSNCPPKTALLYPRPEAITLDEISVEEMPEHLVVIDGTWAQASALYRANSWLHPLPHVVIRPQEQSNYRIRRQPKKGCLSTIEALVQALKSMEPETSGLDQLLEVFDSMVDDQLKRMNQSKRPRQATD